LYQRVVLHGEQLFCSGFKQDFSPASETLPNASTTANEVSRVFISVTQRGWGRDPCHSVNNGSEFDLKFAQMSRFDNLIPVAQIKDGGNSDG